MTTATVVEIDHLAAELRMTRGSVVTLLVAVALQNSSPLLDTFRTLHSQARQGA